MQSPLRIILLYVVRVVAAFLGGLLAFVIALGLAGRAFDCTIANANQCLPGEVSLVLRWVWFFGMAAGWWLTRPLTQRSQKPAQPEDPALALQEELYGRDKFVRPKRMRRLGVTMIIIGALPLPLMVFDDCSVVRCGHAEILVILGAFMALSGGLLTAATSANDRGTPVGPVVSFVRWPVVIIGTWLVIVALLVMIANGKQVLALNAIATLLSGASGITAFAQVSAAPKRSTPSMADVS